MIDIHPEHLEIVKRILTMHVPDTEVSVFGSRVSGMTKEHSDLDLAVKGKGKIARDVMRKLKTAFEESDLPFRVDVVDWNSISAAFKKIVSKKTEILQNF